MSGIVQTQAGDDSDGKIWGIEGMNIVFILVGLLLSIGLTLLLFRFHPPVFSLGVGSLPLVSTVTYVFTLRQGKPKSFDNDLLETLLAGSGWMAPRQQPANPLFIS